MTLAPEHLITKAAAANRTPSDRPSTRTVAGLLIVGEATFLLAGLFHPSHEDANHHHAVFREYAGSHNWGLVHLGQFVGMALFIVGLIALFRALDLHTSRQAALARCAAGAAIISLGLYAVLQAVDGIALKHSVDAWVNAAPTARPAAFASADSIRWLEGLSLLLFGTVTASTTWLPRYLGYVAVLAGLAVMAQGITIGAEGFSGLSGAIGLFALLLPLIWVVGIGVAALRR
jgi:hypothetical protein